MARSRAKSRALTKVAKKRDSLAHHEVEIITRKITPEDQEWMDAAKAKKFGRTFTPDGKVIDWRERYKRKSE